MERRTSKLLALLMLLMLLACSAFAHADAAWSCPDCGTKNTDPFCTGCQALQPGVYIDVTCTNCKTPATYGQNRYFCAACGTRLPVPTPSPTATPTPAAGGTVRYCGECGTKATASNARFCGECGASLMSAPATATPSPKATLPPGLSSIPSSQLFSYFDVSTRHYYHQLNAQEKQLFSLLYDGIAACKETIELPTVFPVSMLEKVFHVLRRDCPELMQLDRVSAYRYQYRGETLVSVTPTYRLNKTEFDRAFETTLGAIIAMQYRSDFGQTDVEKHFSIYRAVIEQCTYLINEPDTVEADGVFSRGYAQCSGYTRAVQLACRFYGIPCLEVTGTASGERHSWLLTQLGGQWYMCDPTWDDYDLSGTDITLFPPNGNAFLRYLNVADSFSLRDHTPDAPEYGFTSPKCTSWDASYVARNGVFVPKGQNNMHDYIMRGIIQRRDAGEKYIAVQFENEDDYTACKAVFREKVLKSLRNSSRYVFYYSDSALFLYVLVP